MIAFLLALLPALPVQQGGPPLDRGTIEAAVDGSLRWLRRQQDLETGSYGSLEATVAALDAFTGSHRAYRPDDGPFVRKGLELVLASQRADGAIAAADAPAEAARATTREAASTLARLPGSAEALARCRAFLGEAEVRPEASGQFRGSAQLLDTASELLGTRAPDGSWGGENDRVLATARAVIRLNRIARVLGELEAGRAAEPDRPVIPPALPETRTADDAEARAAARRAFTRGADFLIGNQVEPGRWGFSGYADPGITAMVVGGLLARGPELGRARLQTVDKALDWLVSLQHEDGSIHAGQLANYVTSASVMALVAGGREQDRPVIERAMEFLVSLQADEGEGYGSSDKFYGGVGYGGDERPDLSNLQMALEALHTGGLPEGAPTYTKALRFLERCQNRSESNDVEVLAEDGATIVSGNDGGAGYAPGVSKAGFLTLADGRRVPRSYGSMTYALLKGYLFAGLPKDDPRVEAAWGWLSKHYTLDVNPGFEASANPSAPYQGLFYYYATMARALALYGEDTVVDAGGAPHAWRSELASRLVALQRPDGSWRNELAPRWYEGNPVLATAYALQTLGTIGE